MARAIEDQLAGNGIEDCTGARRGHAANTSSALGTTVSPAGETAARGVNATPNVGEIAAHGESTAQQGAKAVPGVNATVDVGSDETIDTLRKRVRPQVIQGFEVQWQAAAATALDRLQTELGVQAVVYYSSQCAVSQELFMREWTRKTSGILAHRKRKQKKAV